MAITIDGDGTITGVSVGGLPDGIVDTDMIAAGAVTQAKRGAASGTNSGLLQIVQATKTDQFSTTSTSYVDVTGLSVSITPSSTSNKILVLAMVALGGPQNGVIIGKVLRGTTDLLVGDASSSRTRGNFSLITYGIETTMPTCNFQYLDSPGSTSEQTYKVQVVSPAGETGGVNRTGFHGDNSSYPVGASSITVMEIAA